jgi:hypothetical protein
MTIAPDKAEFVQLLQQGVSLRQAARYAGVARDTVARIARGHYIPGPIVGHRGKRLGRCPECGGLVLLPCLACQLRQTTDEPKEGNPSCQRSK